MRVFVLKQFRNWSQKHSITSNLLLKAVDEIDRGIIDANLGGNLYKKRIATKDRGKSGSVRTLLAYSANHRTVFMYAFEKGERDNVSQKEKSSLKLLGKYYLNLSDSELTSLLKRKVVFEIIKRKEKRHER